LALVVVSAVTAATLAGPIAAGDDIWVTPCGGSYDLTPIPAGFFTSTGGASSQVYVDGIHFGGVPLAINPPLVPLTDVDTVVRRLSGTTPLFDVGSSEVVPIQIQALHLQSCEPIVVKYDNLTTELWNVDVCLLPIQSSGTMTINHECVEGGSYSSDLPVDIQLTFSRVGGGANSPATLSPVTLMLSSSGWWVHVDPGFGLARMGSGTQFDIGCDGSVDPSDPTTINAAAADFYPGLFMDTCGVGPSPSGVSVVSPCCQFDPTQPFCEDPTCVDCVCAQTSGTACCPGQPWDANCAAIASGPCAATGACPCGPVPGPSVVKPKLNPEQAALAAHGVAVANASKLPGQQNPVPSEACCQPAGTCVDVDANDCINLFGGFPQGPNTNCATTVCVNPGPFDDHLATWVPTDLTTDPTVVTFGTGLPIPADFFGPGSDPVVGPVAFRGVPIADTLCDSSVIMRRTQNPFQPADSPPLPPVTIPIEIVALQLTSVDPITVTTGGANPELWNVDIDLSPAQSSLAPGSMTVRKTSANGGGFDSFFDVMPRLTFTRLSDNAVRVLDTGLGSNPQPLQFQVSGVPWAHSTNQAIWIPPGTIFIPGIDPQTDQQVPFSPSTANGTVQHTVCQPVPTKKVCIYDITCVQGDCSSCAAAAVGKCQGPPCPNNTCGVLAGQHSNCGSDTCCIEFGPFECRLPQGEPLCPPVSACTCNPPALGACCRQDGTCVQTLPSQCVAPDVFHGGPCLPPQPCCLPGVGCIDLDPLCCEDQGGVVQPAGSTCSAAPEACCIVDPTGALTCTNIDPLCCDELGGTAQGAGTLCGTDANGNMIDDACEPDPSGVCPLPFPNALCAGLQDTQCIVTNPKNATCDALAITMQDIGVGQLVPVAEKCACLSGTACGPIASDAAGGLVCSGDCANVNEICQVTVAGVQSGQSSLDAAQVQLIPQGAIVNCTCGPVTPVVCKPLKDGSACAPFNCPVPPLGQECLPTCMDIIPSTGQIKVRQCDCGSPNECFAQKVPGAFDVQCVNTCPTPGDVCTETRTTDPLTGVITVCCSCGPVVAVCEPLPDKSACNDFICPTGPSPAALCVVADAGGTAIMPPDCTSGYLSPADVHQIIQGLPAGTTIEFDATHDRFFKDNAASGPGGSLGGEKEVFSSELKLTVTGTGALAAFTRNIVVNAAVETHTAPRTPGDPVQSFDTDMFRLQGELFGDPDFCTLRITAGTDFGLPSPGHTTLTQSGGNWQVDSFFDITYKIEFQGCPGSILEDPNTGVPYSGVAFGTVRMQAGNPAPEKCNPKQITWFPATGQILVEQCLCGSPNECHVDTTPGVVPSCIGGCPPGTVCVETNTPTPDGTGFVIDCSCDPLPTGACCISNAAAGAGCIDNISQPECSQLGGLYLGDGSLCGPDVACCLPDGGCAMTAELCCTQQLGGVPHANQTCGGAPQACCLPDNTCTMADPLCCELDLGGTPEGPNSQCSATPLKCCLPDGTCDFMDPLCCIDKGGVVQTSAACNPSQGCCLPNGVCTNMDPECCVALQGTVSPALCDPATIGGCCLPDGTCQDMARECCLLLGGNPRPTLCEPPQACCVPPTAGGPVTDGCIDTDPECCIGLGGTPLGAGSACSGDADGNGIDDTCQCVDACADCSDADACTCDQCIGGVCANTPRIYGDTDCNGTINIFDLFCVLKGFSGIFSGECCFTNLDIEPCAGNGSLNIFDLFAVLDSFDGINPCNCSAGPVAAADVQQRRTQRGVRSRTARSLQAASIHLIPSSTAVNPGDEIRVDVYAKGVVELRGYELKVQVNGGQRGSLFFDDLAVDSNRKDYVFKDLDAYSALDLVDGRIAGITLADGVSERGSVYLGTFVFHATRDASGTFTLSVQVDHDTFLVDQVGEKLRVRSAKSVEVNVR